MQQRSGKRFQSSGPCSAACSSGVCQGIERLDLQLEEILQAALQLQRLRKQELRIQREHRQGQPRGDGVVDHDQPRSLEARADGRPGSKPVPHPAEDFLHGGGFKARGEVVDLGRADFFCKERHDFLIPDKLCRESFFSPVPPGLASPI